MRTPSANPFKGLEPYGPGDELFGRDADLILMKDRIFRGRTTLLFAGSGVGKTSFFRALFLPEIQERYAELFTPHYHNEWSGDNPLAAVKEGLGGHGTLREILARRAAGAPPGRVVVLDQFEELFQHQLHLPQFRKLIQELSEAINDLDTPNRFIFAMREEFLGHLSVFDNRIPDLFANYYRLKNPDLLQAADIIERTARTSRIAVDERGLKALLADLTRVRTREGANEGEPAYHRDTVIPPHLQIVCRGLWDDERPAPSRSFLVDYATRSDGVANPARRMLRTFVDGRLSTLSEEEQRLTARALDYLVTSQGAKIAYELKSLADHMKESAAGLGRTLDKLSEHPRILRRSRHSGARWFELYHDMYAEIAYRWKERFDKRWRSDQRKEADATSFDRRAVPCEAAAKTGEALLYRLRGLARHNTAERRAHAGRVEAELRGLITTFRHEGRIQASALSADGRQVVTSFAPPAVAADKKERSFVQLWNATNGSPLGIPFEVPGAVRAAAISASGGYIAVLHGLRVTLLSTSRRQRHVIRIAGRGSVQLRFRDDGKALLLEERLGQVSLRAVPTRNPALQTLIPRATALAVSPDGKVAAFTQPGVVTLIDTATGRRMSSRDILPVPARIAFLAFSVDGKRLAAGAREGVVVVLSAPSLVPIGRPVVINAVLRRLALTADGATLVTSSTPDRSYPVGAFHLRRWNIATGQQRGRTVTVSGFSGTGPQITPDGRVARVDTSSSVQIGAIHVSDGSLLGGPWSRGRRVRADWARNGRHLLTHQLGSTAELWNVADLKIVDGADRFIRAAQAALSPTGTKVVVIGVDASAAVHQRSGRLLATLPFEGVVSVTWCTDDVIALMTTKLRIHLWDTGQQAERFSVLAPSKGKLVSIAGGSALLVTDADDSVTRRLVLTGHSRVLKALRGASGGLSFSALSDIFTVDGEKAVQVWDAASGKRVATLKGSTGKGVAALSPDGTFALLEGDEGALEYWNMRTRARQVALPATLVRDAAISASGRQIAVAGIDGLVRVWDGSGRDIGSVQWESMPHGVRFTPDESALVVVSASRVSRVTSDSSGVQKVASGTRRLFGAWEKPTCVFMNGAGTKMVLLSGVLGHKRANLLDFTSAGDRQIKGRPSSLLAAWQKTTALAIAGDEVVPTDIARAPVAEANRKARQKRQRADELEVEDVF